MKVIKARYDLVFFFFFPFLILATLLYFFFFKQIASLYLCSWLLSLALLILIVSPIASVPLGDHIDSSSKLTWSLSLFFSQLLVTVLVWSLSQLLRFDITTRSFHPAINLVQLVVYSGLFPWPILTLTALTWGYYTYRKKREGLYSSAFRTFFHNTPKDSIGIAVDSYVRFSSIFCSFFLLALVMMGLIALWPSAFGMSLSTGLTFPTVFTSSLLLMIMANQYTVKWLHQLMYRKIPTVIILVGLVLGASLVYPGLDYLGQFVVRHDAMLYLPERGRASCLYQDHVQIFLTLIWWALSAMNGAYIAYVSKNKSMRQLICFSFIAFIGSVAVLQLLNQVQLRSQHMWLPITLMLAICTFMLTLIWSQKYRTYFLQATLPSDEPIKPRSIFRLIKIAPFIVACFLSIYLALGIAIWSYLAVFGCLITSVILLMGYVIFLVDIVRESP